MSHLGLKLIFYLWRYGLSEGACSTSREAPGSLIRYHYLNNINFVNCRSSLEKSMFARNLLTESYCEFGEIIASNHACHPSAGFISDSGIVLIADSRVDQPTAIEISKVQVPSFKPKHNFKKGLYLETDNNVFKIFPKSDIKIQSHMIINITEAI